MTGEAAFYRRNADRFTPTGLGLSPWTKGAQMGVPLAGLVVHALETVPSPSPMLTARLTIDILGAVPMEPLTPVTRVLREGRRLQLVEAELRIGDRAWVRATAMRLRLASSPDTTAPPTHEFPATPDAGRPLHWVQLRRVAGEHLVPGPGAFWLRITAALIEGEALRPLEFLAMASDFGSGLAPLVPMNRWTFANVDISVHLSRLPQGEWLLLDAASESAGNGIGLTHSRLGDRLGMVGVAHQTTFLSPR